MLMRRSKKPPRCSVYYHLVFDLTFSLLKLTKAYRLGSRTFFNETSQITEHYSVHMQAVNSEKNR